jgi:hypothetical protein
MTLAAVETTRRFSLLRFFNPTREAIPMRRVVSLITVGALSASAACSAKEGQKADSLKIAQSGAAPAPASRGSFDPATHTATIYAKDFTFDAPDSITAGVTTFHLVNDGPNLHHVQLVRLDSGKTAADLEAALKKPGPFPAWAVLVGGPNAPSPGASFDATLDVKEGNYMLVCLVDIPEHTPHFAKGMVRPMKVVAASGTPATLPTPDVTIALTDYAFDVKGNLTAGKHTIKIENMGPQPHEMELIKYNDGKTMKDLDAWMNDPKGPPPATAIGGVSATAIGTPSFVNVDLTPGKYVMICFIPDAKDGKPHVAHGMMKEFTVN